MSGSLYRKLVAYFLAVLLVAMLVLALIQTQQLRTYLVHRQEDTLMANRGVLSYALVNYELGNTSIDELALFVRNFEKQHGVDVALVDAQGNIVIPPNSTDQKEIEMLVQSVLEEGTPRDSTPYEQIKTNEVIFASPILFARQVRGVIVWRMPLNAQTLYAEAFRSIFLSAAVALVIAAVMTYFIARYLAKPLLALTRAAERIATGDFKNRVQVTTSDEIGQLATAFNDMMGRLDELEAVRRDFIANVSHELRSPLTSIRGFVQGLADQVIPEKDQEHYLRLTLKETERLNRLIDQLLDAARIDAGHFQLDREYIDISQVVSHAVRTLEPTFREKNQELRIDLPSHPLVGFIDPDRIEQITINLLSNACQYTPGGGRIHLTLRTHAGIATLQVVDNGEGISEEDLPHIWDRFFKADRSRTNTKVGTGLGLSIVKSLVEAHGGQITVESTMGQGTTFTVRFPLDDAANLDGGANVNAQTRSPKGHGPDV